MGCDLRAELEREHASARAAFDDAHHSVEEKIAVVPKEEYERLRDAANAAWGKVLWTQARLDQHIREHRCRELTCAVSRSPR